MKETFVTSTATDEKMEGKEIRENERFGEQWHRK
jgi:hypothetical protein